MASVVFPAPLLSAPESSRLLPRNRTTPRSSRGYVTCRSAGVGGKVGRYLRCCFTAVLSADKGCVVLPRELLGRHIETPN